MSGIQINTKINFKRSTCVIEDGTLCVTRVYANMFVCNFVQKHNRPKKRKLLPSNLTFTQDFFDIDLWTCTIDTWCNFELHVNLNTKYITNMMNCLLSIFNFEKIYDSNNMYISDILDKEIIYLIISFVDDVEKRCYKLL
jgi:hypothetical protein